MITELDTIQMMLKVKSQLFQGRFNISHVFLVFVVRNIAGCNTCALNVEIIWHDSAAHICGGVHV